MMRLRLEPEAEKDVQAAYRWYEEQRRGLGEEFLASIDATLAQVQRRPQSFQIIRHDARRAIVRRFPYGVFFQIEGDNVRVFAVLHARLNPKRWRQRRM